VKYAFAVKSGVEGSIINIELRRKPFNGCLDASRHGCRSISPTEQVICNRGVIIVQGYFEDVVAMQAVWIFLEDLLGRKVRRKWRFQDAKCVCGSRPRRSRGDCWGAVERSGDDRLGDSNVI
jgi:hypothetical protein